MSQPRENYGQCKSCQYYGLKRRKHLVDHSCMSASEGKIVEVYTVSWEPYCLKNRWFTDRDNTCYDWDQF